MSKFSVLTVRHTGRVCLILWLWLLGLTACRAGLHGPSSTAAPAGPGLLPKELETRGLAAVEPRPVPSQDSTLIRGGTVMVGNGQVYAPGYLLVQNGRILEVGSGEGTLSPGVALLDASGKYLTPGLIDTHSHMGVYPSPGTSAHRDGNEATDPVTAGVWAEHSFWPQDPAIERAVAGGVTTAAILPGSANLVGGRGVTLHLKPALGARAMRLPGAPELLKLACGENPKRVYGENKRAPSTRMANLRALREALYKAEKYRRDWDRYLQKRDAQEKAAASGTAAKEPKSEPLNPPDRDLGLETLARLLSGELLAQWHCYTADDMLSAIQVSDELGFRISSFHHAVEAYKLRDILAARKIAVSTWYDWYGFKMESFDAIPEAIALIHAAGGDAIVHSDSALGIQVLHLDAARALAAGRAAGLTLSEQDALRWITLNPARALGIEQQVGSLEPGKRADLVVWSHSPFDIRAQADEVMIDGERVWVRCATPPPWSDFELGYSDSIHPGLGGALPNPVSCGGAQEALSPLPLLTLPGGLVQPPATRETVPPSADPMRARPPFILTGALLQQPSTGQLLPGSLLIDGARLVVLPPDAAPPSGVEVISLPGKVITPGLISVGAQLGMAEVGAESPSSDLETKGDPFVPAFRVADGFNPRSVHLPIARSEGIVMAAVFPSEGIVSGQSALVELGQAAAQRDATLLRTPLALHLNLAGGAIDGTFGSRGMAWMKLREIFEDARVFAARRADFDSAKSRPFSLSRVQLDALQPALKGEIPVVVTVHQASDIRAALAFAEQYGLKLILNGAAEAWLEADVLARAGIPVILDPAENLPAEFDRLRVRPDLAWLLRKKGVPVMLSASGPYNARQLRFKAGLAMRSGLPAGEARLAMTEAPARAFGISGAGQLVTGAPATYAVWSGDPLKLDTRLEQLFIQGAQIPLRSRQTLLLDRYRRIERTSPGPFSQESSSP